MIDWLDQPLTAFAFLWRLDRRDGVTIGFTSHDRDLVRGGLTYRSAPGMLPSAIERSDGFEPDSVELSGALTSDALRAEDLLAGRWDGAALKLVAVDWTDPDGEAVPLARGELGAVEASGGQFTVELRGPVAVLDAPAGEETSPECRADLGDRRCRVDLAGRTVVATIVSVAGAVLTLDAVQPDGIYAFGRVRWLDGANAGIAAPVAASAGATVTLCAPPALPVLPGERVEIREGCDRLFSTCVSRFLNAANFRGEPHLPGNDLLTRYVI
jgi:uncharacterized phage protein (TIGR02218 family)